MLECFSEILNTVTTNRNSKEFNNEVTVCLPCIVNYIINLILMNLLIVEGKVEGMKGKETNQIIPVFSSISYGNVNIMEM